MSDIFREVDEEVRNDRMMDMARQYAPYVISIVLAIVLGVAAKSFWTDYSSTQKINASTQYDQALSLISGGNMDEGLAALEAIKNDKLAGYSTLAQLKLANDKMNNDDKAAALNIYDQIKNDGSVDEKLQGLATLMGGMLALDLEDPDSVSVRLAPLAVYGQDWYFSAQEFLAISALRSGDHARAVDIFSGLSTDQTTPAGIRQRAIEILAVIEFENTDDATSAAPSPTEEGNVK